MTDFHGVCDRCGKQIEGMWEPKTDTAPGFTAGWYRVDEDGVGWGRYTNPGERIICDACMWADPRYREVYGINEPSSSGSETQTR